MSFGYQVLGFGSSASGGGDPFTEATGGTVTTSGNYKIHTFTSNGTFTVTAVTPSHLSVNTLLNTEANSVGGNTFGMDGKSSVTGLSYPSGQYITFGTAVPIGKPVTVLHNFDK